MTTYYVFTPESSMPTAEVDSPDTRHARTVYLDYLVRNGLIPWNQRGATRKLIKASRMQPGEIQTAIKLEYGVSEPPEQELEGPREEIQVPVYRREGEVPVPMEHEEPVGEYTEDIGSTEAPEANYQEPDPSPAPRQTPLPDPWGDSPIAKLSRRTRGL